MVRVINSVYWVIDNAVAMPFIVSTALINNKQPFIKLKFRVDVYCVHPYILATCTYLYNLRNRILTKCYSGLNEFFSCHFNTNLFGSVDRVLCSHGYVCMRDKIQIAQYMCYISHLFACFRFCYYFSLVYFIRITATSFYRQKFNVLYIV